MTGERGGGGGGQSRGYRKDRERRRNQECVDPTFRCIWKAIGMILHESIFITTVAGYLGLFAGVGTLAMIGDKLEDFFIYRHQNFYSNNYLVLEWYRLYSVVVEYPLRVREVYGSNPPEAESYQRL